MKRVKIYRTKPDPPNTKRVCRPSRWGNPFIIGEHPLDEILIKYEKKIREKLQENPEFLDPLIGYNLGCYCNLDSPCHADILLKILYEE